MLADVRAPWLRAEHLSIELDRDGFAAGQPITLDERLDRIAFTIEHRTGDAHETEIFLSLPYATRYTLTHNGRPVTLEPTGDRNYPWRARLPVNGATARIELRT